MTVFNVAVNQKVLKRACCFMILLVITLVSIFPILWMIMISLLKLFRPADGLIPHISDFTTDNYRYLFTRTLFLQWLKSSGIVGVCTTLGAMVVSTLAGYSLSRFRFHGRKIFGASLLASQMLPGVIIIVPLYFLLFRLGLTNTYLGLILAHLSFALPFSIWMLWGYFDSIPTDLEAAATVDGATRLQAMYKIILPLSAPGIGAVTIFTFVLSWQDYLSSLTIMSSESMVTIPVGATRFIGFSDRIMWGEMMTLGVLATLPIIIFFVFMQKFLVQGLTAGAIKQ